MCPEQFQQSLLKHLRPVAHTYLTQQIYNNKQFYCNPRKTLEDLYGETALNCHTKIVAELILDVESLRGAICNQAKSTLRDHIKELKRRKKMNAQIFDACNSVPAKNVFADFELKDMFSFLRTKLSAKEYELFDMRFVQGFTFNELADHFNEKNNTICQQFGRLLQKILHLLKNHY